jgi:hypothetical protein
MYGGLHVSEMIIVEDVSSVLFDIICPDGGLSKSVASAVSEGIECFD